MGRHLIPCPPDMFPLVADLTIRVADLLDDLNQVAFPTKSEAVIEAIQAAWHARQILDHLAKARQQIADSRPESRVA